MQKKSPANSDTNRLACPLSLAAPAVTMLDEEPLGEMLVEVLGAAVDCAEAESLLMDTLVDDAADEEGAGCETAAALLVADGVALGTGLLVAAEEIKKVLGVLLESMELCGIPEAEEVVSNVGDAELPVAIEIIDESIELVEETMDKVELSTELSLVMLLGIRLEVSDDEIWLVEEGGPDVVVLSTDEIVLSVDEALGLGLLLAADDAA